MDDHIYMQEALCQAKTAFENDEVPVGAVIVVDQQIIAKAHNQVEMLKDPTAHAEIIAITQAANTLSSKWLYDCTMYVTLEPCSMCAGALVLSRVKRLCFAASDPKSGACGSALNVTRHNKLNHNIDVQAGLLAGESAQVLTDFFKARRT